MGTITAKVRNEDGTTKSVEVNYDLPETLEALTEKYGAEAVADAAAGAFVISLQALMRRHIDKPQEDVQKLVDEWQPGVRGPVVKATPAERAAKAVGQMSAEEKAELLARLQASLAG